MNKVGSVIQREIAELFSQVIDESQYGLITVTRVEVLPDLSEARIHISVLGGDPTEVLSMLERRRGFIRRIVNPRLFLKIVPKFRFLLDTSGRDAQRIELLLKDR